MAAPPATDLGGFQAIANFPVFDVDSVTPIELANPAYVITDYIHSPEKWAKTQNAVSRTIVGPWDRRHILAQNIRDWRCVICYDKEPSCFGYECVVAFQKNSEDALNSLEIRAGEDPLLEVGVYCKKDAQIIPAGSILGEFLGEVSSSRHTLSSSVIHELNDLQLLPENTTPEELENDEWTFYVEGTGHISAKTYGNWTRYLCLFHLLHVPKFFELTVLP